MKNRAIRRIVTSHLCLFLLSLTALAEEPVAPVERAQGEALTNRMDRWHEWVFEKLNGYTERTDNLFAQSGDEVKRVTNSTFSLDLDVELSEEGDPGFKFSPSLGADLYIPHIEHRLHLFIDNISPQELPDSDPMQRDKDLYVGARRAFDLRRIPIDMSAGIKWRWPPILYGEATLKKKFGGEHRDWMVYPKQGFFWFADDGFGTKSSLVLDKWYGDQFIARAVSGVKWTETTWGIEWSQSFTLGYIAQEEGDDVARGIGTRIVINGHKSGSGTVDKYRLELLTRTPLYKRWIYLSVTPRVEWTNDNDWDLSPSLLIAMNFLFWGGLDR